MSNTVADAIVRRDLLLALANVGVVVPLSMLRWSPGWPLVGAGVAVGTFLLGAASDRSRAGTWVLVGVGSLAIVALVAAAVNGSVPVGVIPPAILGMAVGVATNRILFGVLNPVPEARLRREADD